MSKIAFYVRKNQSDKKGLALFEMKIETNDKRFARFPAGVSTNRKVIKRAMGFRCSNAERSAWSNEIS